MSLSTHLDIPRDGQASVSRPIRSAAPPPRLLHSLGDENKSVLSLMANADHIFTGGQGQDITVCARVYRSSSYSDCHHDDIQGLGQTHIYT
jgi:di- and tripeptidase